MTRLSALITARPKWTLLAVLLFVLVAGGLGGPVAGALEDSGGFAAEDSGSTRAVERVETASGVEPTAGIVALVGLPGGVESPEGRERVAALHVASSSRHSSAWSARNDVISRVASAGPPQTAEVARRWRGGVPTACRGACSLAVILSAMLNLTVIVPRWPHAAVLRRHRCGHVKQTTSRPERGT